MIRSKVLKWSLLPLGVLLILAGAYIFSSRFKGKKEKIAFRTDINIEGLMLRPDSPGPHPAILLLHGAGGSHQAYNKLYFRFHANAFLEKGFAVLVYTKRGSGSNDVDYDNFTYNQLLNDALAALKFLRSQKDIDQDNIGIMGLSESGWFTPELAYLDGNIKFIINRVSSPFNVRKTIIHEVRMDALNEGFTEDEVSKHILPITERIWQFYIDVHNDPSLANGSERAAINDLMKEANADDRLGKWFIYDQLSAYDSVRYASRAQRYTYDPLPFLEKIATPIFYVMAGDDINIPTADAVQFLKEYRTRESKEIDIKVYEGASHYLYKYGLGDGPFEGWLYQDGYLELLSTWARNQVER